MKKYRMTTPILKESTKPFDIFDENNNKVGELQRYHNKKFHKILCCFIPSLIVNVLAKDNNGNIRVKCEDIGNLFKSKWKVEFFYTLGKYTSGHIMARVKEKSTERARAKGTDLTRLSCEKGSFSSIAVSKTAIGIGTVPRLLYKNNNREVLVSLDLITRFKSGHNILAEVEHKGSIPPNSSKVSIKIYDSSIDIYEVSSIYYLLNRSR